ncbi:hypothetical protein ACJJTC_007052 [Scirpophaga incertulas]
MNQPSPDPDQSSQQANGTQQSSQVLQQQSQEQSQAIQQQNQLQQIQQQNLQQALQQHQQQNQQQTLQQMLQQHQLQQQQQQQQQLEHNIQQVLQVSQARAQALIQAQALEDHLQAVQQQRIQAALQQQSATLQELQQQAQQQALAQGAVTKQRMPRAKPYNKPRGRMTAYAFFVQTCREEHKKQKPDENVIFAAFSKKCAEKWNNMPEKEKKRFHELAEQDKMRYDHEMQNYVPPKDVKVRGRRRQAKDPNAPKRSLSAFFWFCNDERSKVKASNPMFTMGDIAKELGRLWAAADPATKSKYEALSEQDKARYDREMTAYKMGHIALVKQQQEMEEEGDFETEGDYDGESQTA